MIAKTETLGGCKILSVSGRIDFESALDFEQHINAMIQEDGDGYIIELSQVELLSSAGLRVMLSTAKRVAHRNASLALAAPSQVVRQVFEISHFNLLFKIFPSVPAAIAALKGEPGVVPLDEEASESLRPPSPSGQEEARSTELIIPTALPTESPPALPENMKAKRSEPLELSPETETVRPIPTVVSSPPPIDDARSVTVVSSSPWMAETPTVAPPPLPSMPPPLPPVLVEPPKVPTVAPSSRPRVGPEAQTPPLPSVNRASPVSIDPMPAVPVAHPVTRREAKFPALMEVRAEGASYPCKDGDVIGTEGRLAQQYFNQITNLAPRHLLIGQLEGRWFVFTPKNVQHPFILDGVELRAGERKVLQYVEHQVEFSGHVFGFRLVTEPPKEGFFSRLFGRKR
jgi:anti-anti-sigma factor